MKGTAADGETRLLRGARGSQGRVRGRDQESVPQEGDGSASEDLLNVVKDALNAKSIRPLTDRPIIYSASILNYSIQAEIFIDQGPDENIVLNSCYKAAEEYTKKSHSFNDGVSLSGIYQALHQPGVSRVNLISPAGNIDTSLGQVAFCTGINITRAST